VIKTVSGSCGRNTSDAVTFHHDGSRHRQREPEVDPARSEEVVTREGFGRSSHPETLPPRICLLNPPREASLGHGNDLPTRNWS
jgi:hypothetical protein